MKELEELLALLEEELNNSNDKDLIRVLEDQIGKLLEKEG